MKHFHFPFSWMPSRESRVERFHFTFADARILKYCLFMSSSSGSNDRRMSLFMYLCVCTVQPANQSHLNAFVFEWLSFSLSSPLYANCTKRTNECVLKNEVCVLFAIQWQCERDVLFTQQHHHIFTLYHISTLHTHSTCMHLSPHLNTRTQHNACFDEKKLKNFFWILSATCTSVPGTPAHIWTMCVHCTVYTFHTHVRGERF